MEGAWGSGGDYRLCVGDGLTENVRRGRRGIGRRDLEKKC